MALASPQDGGNTKLEPILEEKYLHRQPETTKHESNTGRDLPTAQSNNTSCVELDPVPAMDYVEQEKSIEQQEFILHQETYAQNNDEISQKNMGYFPANHESISNASCMADQKNQGIYTTNMALNEENNPNGSMLVTADLTSQRNSMFYKRKQPAKQQQEKISD